MKKIARFEKNDAQSVNVTGTELTWNAPVIRSGNEYWTHTDGGSRITLDSGGYFKVFCTLMYSGSVQRANTAIEGKLDGVTVTARGASGYLRNASGHNEASVHLADLFLAQPGQAFWIETVQLAAAGTITAVSGQSSLILERIG